MSQYPEDTPIESQLDSLEAEIRSLEDGPSEALQQLGENTDPDSIARRISLLLELDRAEDAAALIQEREPHQRWCIGGVGALAHAGDLDAADRIVAWSRGLDDLSVATRCVVAFAEGVLIDFCVNNAMLIPWGVTLARFPWRLPDH